MTAPMTSPQFKDNAHKALGDAQLQKALGNVRHAVIERRASAAAAMPEFEALRDQARDIRDHVLQHLDVYLKEYERKVTAAGGHVHFARTSEEACRIVTEIAKRRGAKSVTKGKSMVSEEIGLNGALERAGMEVIETDLGEYIIQLRGETPSHIIMPAVHLNQEDVEQEFRKSHKHLDAGRNLDDAETLLAEARGILRQKFLNADIGITGANFLVAETGTSIIVTNEGNGDLTQTLPKVHMVLASIEKIAPTLEDAAAIMRVLARSATGQDMSVYTTLSTGPRRPGDVDGPEEYHVVLIDNGRSAMLGTEFQDMLRCIRCG
ncbi:MAG: lactate utilization protein, partial [Hyphomicrobiales bacterium]|nr:lactate utilization protein [Hyphomicrobiales bacterium]